MWRRVLLPLAWAWLALGLAGQSVAAEPGLPAQVIFDPRLPDVAKAWVPHDASVAPVAGTRGPLLEVVTGSRERWPGVTLRAPGGTWDLAVFASLEVELQNPGSEPVKVFCRVDNDGADGVRHCVTGDSTVPAGGNAILTLELRRHGTGTLGGRLFGMRGYPAAAGGERTVDPARITQVLLFVSEPKSAWRFRVGRIQAIGGYVRPTAWADDAEPYFPMIDRFGQYRHRNWPGKVADVAGLQANRVAEERELSARPGPAEWDVYGGWAAGPKLEATGAFRVQKHAGRWWLVDPDGRLFWSHGVDCVRMLDATPVAEREAWFEGLAEMEADPDLRRFFHDGGRTLMGHYAGRSPRSCSFAGANLRRKYGPDWSTAVAALTHRRLRSWGLNTIGNWSDGGVTALRRTPYTDLISSESTRMVEGSEGYWGKFPDVFDETFAAGLKRQMEAKRGRSAGDPWCLGYFSDNEMSWGDEVSLALAALRSPFDQPAKRAFLADLRSKYGEIERLNAAWGTTHASWSALAEHRESPERGRARVDLEAFYTRTAETYFRTVREAIRAVAPRQLYLGCRFAWVNARAAAAAARYCDVVSYNLYQREVGSFGFNGGADVPLLIGEFHFGALDRGMFHTGLVPVADQAARARAYRRYVEGALRHPQFVGTHWFQWQDEPTTGRGWDEENYQIGFVDVADTPYAETIAAVREVAARMYVDRLATP